MAVTVVASGSEVAVATSQRVLIPSTFAEFVTTYGRGSEYVPPTGQTTVYRTGDDADIEATIFGATNRNAQTLKARNTLASFKVLNNNNSFGNTNRFTDDLGGQTYTSNYVIDNYTGLAIFTTLLSSVNWNDNIDAALASTSAGFSDWFAANLKQALSIADLSLIGILNYAPFNFSVALNVSTTSGEVTTNAFFIRQNTHTSGLVDSGAKTGSRSMILMRKHF